MGGIMIMKKMNKEGKGYTGDMRNMREREMHNNTTFMPCGAIGNPICTFAKH